MFYFLSTYLVKKLTVVRQLPILFPVVWNFCTRTKPIIFQTSLFAGFSRFYLVSFFHFDRQVSFLRIRFELIISETIPHTVQRVGMTTRRRTQRQIDCWAFFCGLEQFQLVYCGQWSRKVRTKRNFVQCCFVQITLIGKSCPVVYESRLVLLCKGPRCCRWFGALIVD